MADSVAAAVILLLATIASIHRTASAVSCDGENEKRVVDSISTVLTSSKDSKFGKPMETVTVAPESSVTMLDREKLKIDCSAEDNMATYTITAKNPDDNIATFALKGTIKSTTGTLEPYEFTVCLRKIEVRLSSIERLTIGLASSRNSNGVACKAIVSPPSKKDDVEKIFDDEAFVWYSMGLFKAVLRHESDLLRKDPANRALAEKVAACSLANHKAMKFPLTEVASGVSGEFQVFCDPTGWSLFYFEMEDKKFVKLIPQSKLKPEETVFGCVDMIEPRKQPGLKNKLRRIFWDMLDSTCQFDSLITALAGKDKQLAETAKTTILALNKLRFPVSIRIESGKKLELKIDCRGADNGIVGLELGGSAVSHISGIEERNTLMMFGASALQTHATVAEIVEKSVEVLKEKKKEAKPETIKKNIEELLAKACAVKPLLAALVEGYKLGL